MKIHVERMLKIKENLNKILVNNTGQPIDIVKQDTERDNFMDAEEALKYGLIDNIVTKR